MSKWLQSNSITQEEFDKLSDFSNYEHQSILDAADAELWIDTLHKCKDLKIVVDGDYDCDGVMSEVILKHSLHEFGFNFEVYCPNEHDGYGLTLKEAKHIYEKHPDVEIIVTADNGINCKEAVDWLYDKGIRVLVTDHHKGNPDLFPDKALACVDINRGDKPDNYKFKHLSGAYTAYKLMLEYAKRYGDRVNVKYVEQLELFAAISILSDVMRIEGENREIVHNLISQSNSKQSLDYLASLYDSVDAFRFFLNKFGEKEITINTFGFGLIPVINSNRRMLGESELAFKAFDSNKAVAESAITSLMLLNDLRKSEMKEVTKMIDDYIVLSHENLVILKVKNMRPGILGLIASKIANQYKVASLVFNEVDGAEMLGASGRGIGNKSIYDMLDKVHKLDSSINMKFGGHSLALGCQVQYADFGRFLELMSIIASSSDYTYELDHKGVVDVKSFKEMKDEAFVLELQKMLLIDFEKVDPLPTDIRGLKFRIRTNYNTLRDMKFSSFGMYNDHFKFYIDDMECIAFYQAVDYRKEFDIIMTPSIKNGLVTYIINEIVYV